MLGPRKYHGAMNLVKGAGSKTHGVIYGYCINQTPYMILHINTIIDFLLNKSKIHLVKIFFHIPNCKFLGIVSIIINLEDYVVC